MQLLSVRAPRRRFSTLVCAAIAGAMTLWATPGSAQSAATVFSRLKGSWSGEGIIALSNGSRERIRCRGDYRLPSRDNLQLALNCASDSYRFQLRGDITAQGHTIAGTWSEVTRNVAGQISGKLVGNRIEARAEGQTFTALMTLTASSGRQQVSIQSPGSEMSGFNITLRHH
jgi:hypothetical protein